MLAWFKPNKLFRSLPLLTVALGLFSIQLNACVKADDPKVSLAPLDQMPMEVQNAPTVVREAYQFAVANPDVLKQIPCYCGCGSLGHTSNFACYINEGSLEKEIVFDSHALGCSICVDITQDVMHMLGQGEDLEHIRIAIDQTYSRYGPSNNP